MLDVVIRQRAVQRSDIATARTVAAIVRDVQIPQIHKRREHCSFSTKYQKAWMLIFICIALKLGQKMFLFVLCTVTCLYYLATISLSLSISQGSRLDAGNASSLRNNSGFFPMSESSPPVIICDAVEYGYGGHDLDTKSCMDAYFTFTDFPDGDLAIGNRVLRQNLDIGLPFRLISGRFCLSHGSQVDCLSYRTYQVMGAVSWIWSKLEMCALQRQQV